MTNESEITNEEAIKILQNDGCCQDCTFGGYPCKLVGCETHQALDKAIKALKRAECKDMQEVCRSCSLCFADFEDAKND